MHSANKKTKNMTDDLILELPWESGLSMEGRLPTYRFRFFFKLDFMQFHENYEYALF